MPRTRTKPEPAVVFETKEEALLAFIENPGGRKIFPSAGGVYILAATKLQALRAWSERLKTPTVGDAYTMKEVHEEIKAVALSKMREHTNGQAATGN